VIDFQFNSDYILVLEFR